jgi:hypothetical protein
MVSTNTRSSMYFEALRCRCRCEYAFLKTRSMRVGQSGGVQCFDDPTMSAKYANLPDIVRICYQFTPIKQVSV